MIVAKLIGVKLPKPGSSFIASYDQTATEIDDATKLRDAIKNKLFTENNSYALVRYDSKLYICEKIDKEKYTRREINYHPLESFVKM